MLQNKTAGGVEAARGLGTGWASVSEQFFYFASLFYFPLHYSFYYYCYYFIIKLSSTIFLHFTVQIPPPAWEGCAGTA